MTDTPASDPAAGSVEAELAAARREYRQVAAKIADLGFIHHGTVIHRYAATPATSSGAPRTPYYQWTSKQAGKTITRTLTKDEAALYREWIDNDRELRSLIKQLRAISERAAHLILKEVK